MDYAWSLRLVYSALYLTAALNIHAGVDVNIYSSSISQANALIGNHENTEVGNFLRDYLDLDLAPLTKELNEKVGAFNVAENLAGGGWVGHELPESKNVNEMDHYHGDFKRNLECGSCH